MAKSYYQSEKVLLVVPQPRGEEIRVMEGARSDGTTYIDIRVWYRDDFDQLQPGKGLGKPDINGTWDAIGKAIMDRKTITTPRLYNPKTKQYEEAE